MAAAALTEGERRTGLVLAAAALVAFAALSNGTPLFLAIGTAMAVALGAACLGRNRVAAAALAFVTAFGPWGFAAIAGAVYAGFGLWLLAKAPKPGAAITSPERTEGS